MALPSSVFLISAARLLLVILGCCILSVTSSMTPVDSSTSESNSLVNVVNRQRREATSRKLVVTTILEEPYMMMKLKGHFLAGNDRFEGYLADILHRLSATVGFQYETRLSRDGKYGELGPDGVWNGMIGEVQSGEADIAAGALIVTDTLRQYVNFTEPFLSMRWSALIRRPTSPSRKTAGAAETAGGNRRLPPSSSSSPGGGGSRRLSTAIQLLRSDYTWGVVENSVAHQMLATSTDPVAQALYQRMTSASSSSSYRGGSSGHSSTDPFVRSVQEGVDRARHERYAFILDSPTAEYVASREPCDLYTIEPFLDVATYAFAVRKRGALTASVFGSGGTDDSRQLRLAIDREMRRMKQSGEMQAMYLRWWRDECVSTGDGLLDDEFAANGNSGTGRRLAPPDMETNSGDVSRRHPRVSSVASSSYFFCSRNAIWRTVNALSMVAASVITVVGILTLMQYDVRNRDR